MSNYRGFAPRPPGLPLKGGQVDFSDAAGMVMALELNGDAELPPVEAGAAEPFVGVTTGGVRDTDLFRITDEGLGTEACVRSATRYLATLSEGDLARARLPIDADEWRLWTNAFLTFPEHGLRLQDLDLAQREAALAVMQATLSAPGFEQVRGTMRMNGELGNFLGLYQDTLTEWCYWFTIFGNPTSEEPWGWQLQGHHVDVHCFIVGRQVVLTPTFLGAEFRSEELFSEHRQLALEFAHSMTPRQRGLAVLYPSMRPGDLPHALGGLVEGRTRAGAGRDNLVLPYEGLKADTLTRGQRDLLMRVVDPYLTALPQGSAAARRAQVTHHLDEARFSWIGGVSDDTPFYYRVHSPVILIEYDNHPGVFLDIDEPQPFHVHTVVRTPNGGDYGKDLLAQHYATSHPPSPIS